MQRDIISWTPAMRERLISLRGRFGSKWTVIAKDMDLRPEQVRSYWRKYLNNEGIGSKRIEESPYPKYDQPLEMEGDALVIPDIEMPFHNADFVNRCLDLAQAWNVRKCILAGDFVHFDSLSGWEANWQMPNGHGGLDDRQEQKLVNFAMGLSKNKQEELFAMLEEIGPRQESGDPNLSEEMRVVRKTVKALTDCFDEVDADLGNHEGRLLTTLKTPLFPTELTRLIDAQSWRIAPYYFQYLYSGGEKFIVEHPKSSAIGTAEKLASKFQCHAIVAHAHLLRFSWDVSGKFYAIMSGCCVDEARLPYASQRHTNAPAHSSGATIVREGHPYLLHDHVDWKRMAMM